MEALRLVLIVCILRFTLVHSQFDIYQLQFDPYIIYGPSSFNEQKQRPANGQQNYLNQQTDFYFSQEETQYNRYPQNIQTGSNLDLRVSERKCNEYMKFDDNCNIGQGLIVGGTNAKAGEFPHMVAIGYQNLSNIDSFRCGGSLISEQFVLTAASCRASERKDASFVRLGAVNLAIKEQNFEDIAISAFIIHEKFDKSRRKNDIAVIKLVNKVEFSRYIRPACLLGPNNSENIIIATATGWGLVEPETPKISDFLQKVELPIIDQSKCRENLLEDYNIDETQICAGEGGKDTCNGDSGGPLQIISPKNKCVSIVIGITSFGISCGLKDTPGIYTRVPAYTDWIEEKVWGSG